MSSAVAVAYEAHFKTTTHKNKFKLKCDSLQTSNVKDKANVNKSTIITKRKCKVNKWNKNLTNLKSK